MSEEEQKPEQHQNSIHLKITNDATGEANRKEAPVQRLSKKTARTGALVLQAYEGRKGGISPLKILISGIKRLVVSSQADFNSTVSKKAALDLYEDVTTVVRLTQNGLDKELIDQIVDIFRTHPVYTYCGIDTGSIIYRLKGPAKNSDMDFNRIGESSLGGFGSGMANQLSPSEGSDSRIANLLQDVGPACTKNSVTLRETLAEISNGALTDAGIARLIFFFSDKGRPTDGSGVSGVSAALLGSLIPGRGNESSSDGWNLRAVAEVLEKDSSMRDWNAVARCWDFPGFFMEDPEQFRTLVELFRAGAKRIPPLVAFTDQWRNTAGQLSVIESIVAVSQSVYVCPLNEDEVADATTAAPGASGPDPQSFASMAILQRLLFLSDIPSLYRRVRDLFVKGLLSTPEVLLCSLVRLQLVVANKPAQSGGENFAAAGMQIKTELMRELIPLFFRPSGQHRVQNGPAALRRLYAISPNTVTAACFEAWRSTVNDSPQMRLATLMHIINIARLLPSPADAIASLLNGNKDPEFSIAIAFVMADNDYLQLKPWLIEKLSNKSSVGIFATAIISYLAKTHSAASPRAGEACLVSVENIAISLGILQALDGSILSQAFTNSDGSQIAGSTVGDNLKALMEACLSTHPSLRGSLSNQETSSGASSARGTPTPPSASDEDIEATANAYFQQIYTSEQSIGEVIEMLKRFKTSGNKKENDIFACMIHNLFDEYRFFSKYPEKELRITGILLGSLIQEQLVSSITLMIALRYVLEALRKPPSPTDGSSNGSGKMFEFGMFALEQFKGRLHEWPQYCSHIVQIPHLKEGYSELVTEIEAAMLESQNRASGGGGSSAVGTPSREGTPAGGFSGTASIKAASGLEIPAAILPVDSKPRIAEFGPGLGRAVTEGGDDEKEEEAPPSNVLDRVQFLINNLVPANVEAKAKDLKKMMDPKYFGWLAHFIVVKRISTQANFHSLYLTLLDQLGDFGKGLVEKILASTYQNIGKLLRSSKITTSSSERSYLKNLGIWLGQITLAKNRPILQIMLDCKELLLQGYETGKLIAVAPFLAKTLEGAKGSLVFRPPNPWLMGLLGVFRSVYNVEGLKMNIKFEVEVLCKNLGIRLEDIPIKTSELAKRVAPVKERNPDFNIKASQKAAALASSNGLGSADSKPALAALTGDRAANTDDQDTVIPNLAAYVKVNPSLAQLLQQAGQGGSPLLASLNIASLKRSVPIAVDRAIREIIQPVVERSVTIACITTKEIVTKDFAMESDENKMRKAGQLMVANLAGSLALVTCRDPLRSSVSTHLRQLLVGSAGSSDKLTEQEQNVIEQCVQMCATDNVELGCILIEKAATEKAVRDVDEALSQMLTARRKHREQTSQPFYDMSIFGNGSQRYPAALPEQLRPKPGGLRSEHFQLYESFQRIPRQTPGAANLASGGSQPNIAPGRSAPSPSTVPVEAEVTAGGQKPQLGIDALSAIAAKLDSAVTQLLTAAGPRAPEVKLPMLPPDHHIRQLLGAVKQVLPNVNQNGVLTHNLTTAEQESVLAFSQGIFKRLYELNLGEPLRLETLVALLENVNVSCPKLGKDIGTWATYAPTNTEQQRRLHRTVLLLLIRSRLLAVGDLDVFLAARTDNGRNPIWVEFSLLFVRTAFMERISTPSDFPKLMDLMTRISEGRSQATQQVLQAYRKPILRMLEETQSMTPSNQVATPDVTPSNAKYSDEKSITDSISSLSPTSLSRMTTASRKVAEATEGFARNDPPTAKQQVTTLLENWIRIQNEAEGNEKVYAQFLAYLQQMGIGKVEEHTERFLRLSILIVIDAANKAASSGSNGSRSILNYTVVDMYTKLLVLIFKHLNSGGTAERIEAQRLSMLNKILGVAIRSMMWDAEKTKKAGDQWDQRTWYRLFLNLVIDINKPDPAMEKIKLGVLSVFGAALHVAQPLVLPAFAFSWFELISHRHFLPNLLLVEGQKGWNIAHQLLIDHFLFLEPQMKRGEMVPAVKKLYEGTLRVFLVLLHDFPSFLAGYHLSFCNVIPYTCVQLRNLVLSASPKGMLPPDPFTPNLKIDLLPEISQSPIVLSNVLGPIESFRGHLDSFLKDGHNRFLAGLPSLLMKEGSKEVDAPKVNSLVMYVGMHALAKQQSSQISLSRTPEMEVLQKLMDFDDKGRYICLNAIANQLRYPSSHTHYFSCAMLFLFIESKDVAVKEQTTRVLLERLILHRPHPWGLLVTFIELIKNQRYGFWNFPFTRCATEIEKVFENVARSCMPPGQSVVAGGED